MTAIREQRFSTVHLRSETSSGKTYISGYTARFNTLSADLGGFKERIQPGAFDRTLAAGGDVTCTFNHEASLLFGRKKNQTLTLSADRVGLFFRCQIQEAARAGQDVLSYLRRGDLDQCSFGFVCQREAWSRAADPNTGALIDIRTILDCDLFDVGPVTDPAYPEGTSVQVDAAARMKTLFPYGMPEEVRSRFREPKPLSADELALRAHARSHAERLLPGGLAADYERERLQRRIDAVREEFGL